MQDSDLTITTLDNKVRRTTEILWHKISVAGSIPGGDKIVFYDLVERYWISSNICVRFEC